MSDDTDRDAAAVATTLRTPPSSSNRSATSVSAADATHTSGNASASARRQRGKRKRSRGTSSNLSNNNNNNNGSGATSQTTTSGDADDSRNALLTPPLAKRKSGGAARASSVATTTATSSDAVTADADGNEAATTTDTTNDGADADAQWGCPACTFLNDAVRSFCEMCGTTNPTPQPGPRGAGVLGGLFAGSPDATAPWSCIACTMANAPGMRACAVCGTVNPQASMHAALSLARRARTGSGGLLSDAIDVDDMSDSDDDDDEDDGHSNGDSDDDSDAAADTDTTWSCRACVNSTRIPSAESACPACRSARPLRRKQEQKARRRSKSKPMASAYGVSSDVLRTLARDPTSSRLTDTLQALTHTLAMLDASADNEWGDLRGASLFIRGFGATATLGGAGTNTARGAKDPALLTVLCEIFSESARAYPVDARLLAIQSINYLMKMDRHVFTRAVVLEVVELYLTHLLLWSATDTSSSSSSATSSSSSSRSAQMVVEECLTGLASVCNVESAALRTLVRAERFRAFVACVAQFVATDSSFHANTVVTALELLQKCCVRMRWRSEANADATGAGADAKKKKSPTKASTTSLATSDAALNQDGVMTLALAHQVVALLRRTLQHKHVPLRVLATKCLLFVFRRVPFAQPEVIAALVPADVLAAFIAVVTNASGSESDDARLAMLRLLYQLFDNRPQLVSLVVEQRLYVALFDGVLPLLQSTSSALGASALKLTALLARLVCRKHSTAATHSATTTPPPVPTSGRMRARLDSAPDPDVLATLLLDFVCADSIAAVSALLKDGADLNFPQLLDTAGREIDKPLHVAVAHASLAMVKYLVKRGADVHQTGAGGTALHIAAKCGRCDVVAFLLQCGASVNAVDRDGKSVLAGLAADSNSDVAATLPSPVQRMLESRQRLLRDDDDDDDVGSDDDGSDRSGGEHASGDASAHTWFYARDDDDDDEEDDDVDDFDDDFDDDEDDDEDDEFYLHDYDDEDAHVDEDDDDDDEIPSDSDDEHDVRDDVKLHGASSDVKTSDSEQLNDAANSKAKTKKKNTKRHIDSISSETESVGATDQHHADSAAAASRDAPVGRDSDADLRRRQGFTATPEAIDGFSRALLRCLLTVLYDMDIQNVERSVISTLACVLEMAPSQLVRSLSDRDIVLVLDMVHFLLQGQKLDQHEQQQQYDHDAVSGASVTKAYRHAAAATISSSSSTTNQLKANLSASILALRTLQAIVRKSAADSSIFYQIERRGICEQIEHLNAKSATWLSSSSSVASTTTGSGASGSASTALPTACDTIFSRGLELLATLRANMVESGMLHLHKLKNLARRMRELPERATGDDRELAVVDDLVELFEQPNAITTYEFKQSELLPAVLHFVAPLGALSASRAALLLRAFERSPASLQHLVARLQSIVTHDEVFPVVSYNPGRGRELYPLTRQLKISFARVLSTRNRGVDATDADGDTDEAVAAAATMSKTIHSSPLTHFQSFERTVARCLPVRDSKLAQLGASLIGHSVQKVVDGKWKKFAVCGFDATRSFHLLRPVGGSSSSSAADDDMVEMVLHDSQYRLTGSVGVYTNVRVAPEVFGAVVPNSDASSSNTLKESKKRRKASHKRKRKLSLTKAPSDATDAMSALCDVEVRNDSDRGLGPFAGAWYAGVLVADASAASRSNSDKVPASVATTSNRASTFETLVKPHGSSSYAVQLISPGKRVVQNVPASALRKRLATPQVGSVVEVDGALGEVTKVYASSGGAPIVDVKVTSDVEKVRVKKERVRYPPIVAAAAAVDSADSRIEAMSLRRMFPARESSLIAGSVGDRVWISPVAGSAVKDLYVAGTIASFPSGLESIREASTLHVTVTLALAQQQQTPATAASVTLKVQQEQVVNFANGSRRGGGSGSSRLLAALQMASNRAGRHDRLFGSSSAGGVDGDGAGSTMDQLRQFISRVSHTSGGASDVVDAQASGLAQLADASRLSAPTLVTSSLSAAPVVTTTSSDTGNDASLEIPRLDDAADALSAAPSRTSSPVARRAASHKRPDESMRNESVWTHMLYDGKCDDSAPAWICASAPRVNLCLAYGGRESSDAPLDLAIANSRVGVSGGSGAASRSAAVSGSLDNDGKHVSEECKARSLLFGKSLAATASMRDPQLELTPRVRAILLRVFTTFEATAVTRTPSPKKKKRKLSAVALAADALRLDDASAVPATLWDIDRFCAFMKRSIGWPKAAASTSVRHNRGSSSSSSSVELCVLFSKFATAASHRRGLDFSGFVALMTAFCSEPAKAKLVLLHVRALGYSDAHLAGSSRAAKSESESATVSASSVAPAPKSSSASPTARARDDVDDDLDAAMTTIATAVTPTLCEFPADQNVLKCLHVLQQTSADAMTATAQPSLPPWKYLYKVLCDYRVDWTADASHASVAPSASASSRQAPTTTTTTTATTTTTTAMNLETQQVGERSEPTARDVFEWLDHGVATATSTQPGGFEVAMPPALSTATTVTSAVRLLHCLFDLTANGAVDVPVDVWTNPRLYGKLELQLQDVLSVCCGIYPSWCDALVTQCRFFFPRDLRERLFRATAFGCTRSLYWFRHQLQVDESGSSSSDSVGGTGATTGASAGISSGGILNHEISITPIPKERVKVHRANILQSAEAVMKLHAKRRAILDIVFAGEKGYGSGVTAAFYSATALALQSVDENARRRLWVTGDEGPAAASTGGIDGEDAVIRHANGLFPAPYVQSPPARVLDRFRMVGRLAGKALMDERLLPLPLAPQFLQLVVGERVDVRDVASIFQGPGRIVLSMHAAAEQLAACTSGDRTRVQIDGMDVATWLDAVAFTFIEPLSQEPLMPNGADIAVTTANLRDYVECVLRVWLTTGVDAQVQAFRDGLSDVVPLAKLQLLSVDELLAMLCGDADISWDAASLRQTLKLAHGYTGTSAPVAYFVAFLDSLSVAERRAFLLYATGCPNLPPGGFGALKPAFEVVRRVVETDDVDRALPFARTCTNTLHLPAYSSQDVLTRQMRFAIANSRGVIDRD